MAFFDRMGETISSKGKVAAQKAKEVAEMAKLNAQLVQLEGKVKAWYQIIGEKVYYSEAEQVHEGLEVEFDMLNNAFAEMGRIQKEIAAIKGMRICPECRAEVASDSLYCPKCGVKFEDEEEEDCGCACEEETCESSEEEACECAEETCECEEEACECAEEACECAEEACECEEETCGCEEEACECEKVEE